ncbi:MAG: ribbon-helix-helix protein, CopG family [Bacillota bacterium]
MGEARRITITLPADLLEAVDGIVIQEKRRRSEVICDALRGHLESRRRQLLRQQLVRGYQEMGQLNLHLAEDGTTWPVEAAWAGGGPLTGTEGGSW